MLKTRKLLVYTATSVHKDTSLNYANFNLCVWLASLLTWKLETKIKISVAEHQSCNEGNVTWPYRLSGHTGRQKNPQWKSSLCLLFINYYSY
jgi:hypothetical protein